jgi:glutathione S-transferase
MTPAAAGIPVRRLDHGTMLLYDSEVSGNCYKVRLLLSQLGVRYERHEVDVVDHSGRAELLEGLNPALRVPTLVLDDGRSLGESNAILWYLADGTGYLPHDGYARAKVLQWLFFEQYSHEPYIAVTRFWLTIAQTEPTEAELAVKHAGGYAALAAMERQLGSTPFLTGDRYTIADIALYAYTHVAEEAGFDLARHPAVTRWLERVAAQPGHVPIAA